MFPSTDMPNFNELHYHITVVSPCRNIPSIITSDRYTALNEFGKVVKLVQDLSGLIPVVIKDEENYKERSFLDQTTVKWWICFKECMHD